MSPVRPRALASPGSRSGWGASWLKFVTPLPYPISQAGLAVGIWFAVGLVYLAYLAVKHPGRVRDMEEVFD
jgi:hypothetical protein